MRFNRYGNLESFRSDVLDVLLEDELYNNLPVSIVADSSSKSTPDWLMGTVTDGSGRLVLTVFCAKPFNILLYIPRDAKSSNINDSLRTLSDELHRLNFHPPGIFAHTELARHFARVYTGFDEGSSKIVHNRPMVLMRLDKLSAYEKAPGACRALTAEDLSFVPLWEQAFNVDCGLPTFSQAENKQRIRTRIGRDNHYIWEDGLPVSQAVFGRETPNGAVINWVYTPPLYRGRGYATSVVGELSCSLLKRGKQFCCLFAEADNKTSCGIYHRLGYYDVCEFEEICFKW